MIVIKIGIFNKDKIYNGYLHYKYETYTASMEEIALSDIDDLLSSKQNYFVYIGSKDCPSCLYLINNVNSMVEESGINKVYYLPINMSKDFDDYRFNQMFEDYSLKTIPALIINDGAEEMSVTTAEIRNLNKGD